MSNTPEKQNFEPNKQYETVLNLNEQYSNKLREDREKILELSAEKQSKQGERARADALETAKSKESISPAKAERAQSPPATRRGSIRQERDESYKRTMEHVQSELSATSRAFSKVIHTPVVEKVSAAAESTIARPNSILAGSICAFIFTLALYLLAKNFGYRLSGFETIGAFILGWIIGILFDFFRVMVTGKRG